ncbi:MAG: hypothetical protein EOM31_10855 [Bacteroidia bacterium]|nr:hypothetical protein [Bacteroidia bacterium]
MNTFRSIDELVKSLEREKLLLKELFNKRKSPSFRYEYALELTEYKEERIRYLIEYGVIRDSGDFMEMEDIYLKFFEDVLEVNEEINISYVQDHLDHLNESIDYYLKENNETRKYNYQREVKRYLKNIALTTTRNVMDLKRNMDNTYKNEPNYSIKKAKLAHLDEKRKAISTLIIKTEELIDIEQPTFFRVAMDIQMRNVVSDVKYQLNEAYHYLIEIEKQIIHYLNLIAYQNRIFEKIKKLKYLRDQFLLIESTDIKQVIIQTNPVWMEPQTNYRIKLSIDTLRTSEEALKTIIKVMARNKEKASAPRNLAKPIPDTYLNATEQMADVINLEDIYKVFAASGTHLFRFVMNYNYQRETSMNDRLVFFCQLASQYADSLNFTNHYECTENIEYPLIYHK